MSPASRITRASLLALLLFCVACTSSRQRTVPTADDPVAFVDEVARWNETAQVALNKTHEFPKPTSEAEGCWRKWQQQLAQVTMEAIMNRGLRDPSAIKTDVLRETSGTEREFLDASVRLGYSLTTVLGYLDAYKATMTEGMAHWVEVYVRDPALEGVRSPSK